MCSWGSNQKLEKFYKGAQNDTPWNKDLLWRYHVSKEYKQERVNAGELEPSDAAIKRRQQRMVMGITGTLIPAVTPRQRPEEKAQGDVGLPRPRSRAAQLSGWDDSQSVVSRSPSRARSRTGSMLSSSSSLSSIGSLRLQEMIASQLHECGGDQIDDVRRELEAEKRRREAADRKLQLLCEKLGVNDDDLK